MVFFGLAKELQHAEQCVKWDVRNVIVPKSVVPLPDLLHLNLCFVVAVVVFFDLYTHFSFKISLICYGAADNWSHQKAEKCIECTVVNMYKWIGNDDRTELWRKNQSDPACIHLHNDVGIQKGAKVKDENRFIFSPWRYSVRAACIRFERERSDTEKGVKPCSVDCNGSTHGK